MESAPRSSRTQAMKMNKQKPKGEPAFDRETGAPVRGQNQTEKKSNDSKSSMGKEWKK